MLILTNLNYTNCSQLEGQRCHGGWVGDPMYQPTKAATQRIGDAKIVQRKSKSNDLSNIIF